MKTEGTNLTNDEVLEVLQSKSTAGTGYGSKLAPCEQQVGSRRGVLGWAHSPAAAEVVCACTGRHHLQPASSCACQQAAGRRFQQCCQRARLVWLAVSVT